MSNVEILINECTLKGFEYDGENLKTYQEWKKEGYQVQKGEKAFLQTKLWIPITRYNKETKKKEEHFIQKTSSLFTDKQVKKIKQ